MRNLDVIANTLRWLRPDRGNLYASRTVRTKGAAAFAQWRRTCDAFAAKIRNAERRATFLAECGYDEP